MDGKEVSEANLESAIKKQFSGSDSKTLVIRGDQEVSYKKIMHVIDIANKVRDYLNIENIKFICGDFMKYNFEKKFEVILSLANHSTFDKGINDTNYYFEKVGKILEKKGILILESHSPLYEKTSSYLNLIETLQNNFYIIEKGNYEFGNYYDKNRKFHILVKKN